MIFHKIIFVFYALNLNSELIIAFENLSNINFILNLIKIYNISEVFIATPDIFRLENLLNSIWNTSSISFNIHTKDFKYSEQNEASIHHHDQELLILTAKSLKFRRKLRKHINARFVILLTSESEEQILQRPYALGIFNGIIFQNKTPLIFNIAEEKIFKISSIDEIHSFDRFIIPEISWPLFHVNEKFTPIEEDDIYPLLIHLEDRLSGVFAYFAYTFRDYLNSRIKNKLTELRVNFKERFVDQIGFDFLFVGPFRGYPLFSKKQCLMLPILDEILVQEYLRKPFTNCLWLLLITFLFYITCILRAFIHEDTFQCIFESLTLSCGSLYKGLNSRNSKNRIIYLLLFLYGFVVWNLYSAKVSSFSS